LCLTLDEHVALQLLAQVLVGSVKRSLHHKLLQLSLMDLAARSPLLRLHLGPLDHLEAHLYLGALDLLEALQHLGAPDHLEVLLHLVALQYLRLLSQSSHPLC